MEIKIAKIEELPADYGWKPQLQVLGTINDKEFVAKPMPTGGFGSRMVWRVESPALT